MLQKEKTVLQQNPRKAKWRTVWAVLFALLLTMAQLLSLEFSNRAGLNIGILGTLDHLLTRPLLYTLVSALVILLLDCLLLLLTANVGWTLALSSLLIMALSITNHFVFLLHGTPFTFAMIRNTATAMEVLGSYSIHLDAGLLAILILGVLGMVSSLLLFRKVRCSRKKGILLVVLAFLLQIPGFLMPNAVIPKGLVKWSWDFAVTQFGYLNCLVKESIFAGNGAVEPDGYDAEKLTQVIESYSGHSQGNAAPDVILILNETLCDLRQVTELQEDRDFLSGIYGLSNARVGYAVVPGVGGGTNRSEYELLTGNSLQSAPGATPFQVFHLDQTDSIVSMLKALGYETQAIHSEPGKNYNRLNGYPALGFDTYHFDVDFEDLQKCLGRKYASDASVYRNMLRWYEQMGDGPRFFYTLTIQNHGGYDQMKEEDYVVHTERDFGELTSQVSEYLSCISESDKAFVELTEFFEDYPRDVIICMVGDHGPNYIRSLADESLPVQERETRIRTVPYVIWSNRLDLSGEIPERISLNYLAPTVLQLAGIPLSPYFDFQVSLRDQIPVMGAFGSYMASDGTFYPYGEEGPLQELAETYQGFAYANIIGEDFMKAFNAPKAQ